MPGAPAGTGHAFCRRSCCRAFSTSSTAWAIWAQWIGEAFPDDAHPSSYEPSAVYLKGNTGAEILPNLWVFTLIVRRSQSGTTARSWTEENDCMGGSFALRAGKVRNRRISPIALGRGDVPLSDRRAGGQPAQREPDSCPKADSPTAPVIRTEMFTYDENRSRRSTTDAP
jgi:hypothetical protein